MVKIFSPNTWQMMTFLNLLAALIPKIPFSLFFFADFWVWVTSEAWGSVLVGFWGYCQLSPIGGGLARGLYRTPPPLFNRKPAYAIGFSATCNYNQQSRSWRHSMSLCRHFLTEITPNWRMAILSRARGGGILSQILMGGGGGAPIQTLWGGVQYRPYGGGPIQTLWGGGSNTDLMGGGAPIQTLWGGAPIQTLLGGGLQYRPYGGGLQYSEV